MKAEENHIMEQRFCEREGCEQSFTVYFKSAQRYCSKVHQDDAEGSAGGVHVRKKAWNHRNPSSGNSRADGRIWEGGAWRTPEQVAKRKERNNERHRNYKNDPEKKSASERVTKLAMHATKPVESIKTDGPNFQRKKRPNSNKKELNEPGEIPIETKKTGDPMLGAASEDSKSYTEGDAAETPSTASTEPLKDVALVKSQSMNLVDSTANHLFDLMKGLTKNAPPDHIRMRDPEVVNAACNCAKQIHNLLRLKLDAIKTMKGRGERE